jgi:hypothetical protein
VELNNHLGFLRISTYGFHSGQGKAQTGTLHKWSGFPDNDAGYFSEYKLK